jgi:enoyl-CoA hydratase/carnithine racemase
MNQPKSDRVVLLIEGGIAQVRLNRPDKLNALDRETIAVLVDVGARLREEPDLRAVVLAGVGKAFCAGLDLREMAALAGSDNKLPEELTRRSHGDANAFQQVSLQWRDVPVPVIAAVHGVCFGGGLQIACGADIRVVHPEARLSAMEIAWGIVPDMGGFALWPSIMRDDAMREMIFTAREFSGEEGALMGLVTHLDDDPLSGAEKIARTIARLSPDAIRASKRLANLSAAGAARADMLAAESAEQAALLGTVNQREAVAARLAGRKPLFTAR